MTLSPSEVQMLSQLRAAQIGEEEAHHVAEWAGKEIAALQAEVEKWKRRHASVCLALAVSGVYAAALTVACVGSRLWR